LDFSGKELNIPERKPLLPEDKYGWRSLGQDTYLIEFNEQIDLKEKEIAILQPREELLQNCCFHPVLILTSKDELSLISLSVSCKGTDIKQNTCISGLRIAKT